uniref:Outer envelope pore protein 21, chloroplastic n=1 Tax=Opuntia streptacantha TaxID=393608 RepID=A0A7C9DBB8_OPUST
METSLRYSGVSKSLRIHAKESFPIDSLTFFQVQGELDTSFGRPSYFSAILRHIYPKISASLGLGLQYDRREKLRYTMLAKKAFPLSPKGLVSFNVKGRCNADQDFNKRDSKAAVEFTWSIFNFQKDQDVRFKVGYDIIDSVPYMQVRENNWTVNADAKGRWNVRYDL